MQTIAKNLGVGDAANIATDSLTCSSAKVFCFMDGELGQAIQHVCPEYCGLCGETIDGKENPRNPESYRITAVNYHAHIIASEMYTTLLREADDDESQTKIVVTDLESREFWDYNDQASLALGYDIAASDSINGTLTGIEVKPGDKIEATCVYDSTSRQEESRFGLSTYDEMCITGVYITFETPKALLNEGNNATSSDGMVDIFSDIKLRSFICELGDDVHQGFLTAEEHGRDIWLNHPIEESNMCTYPVEEYRIFESFMLGRSNCPEEGDDEEEPGEGGG